MRLIEAVSIHRGYARYRYQELKNLEKLLVNQKSFPYMRIRYFLSDNIPLIKYEILRSWLKNKDSLFSGLLTEGYGQGQIGREKEYLEKNREKIRTDLTEALSKGDESRREKIPGLTDQVLNETLEFLKDLEDLESRGEELPVFAESSDTQKDFEHIYFYYLLEKLKK